MRRSCSEPLNLLELRPRRKVDWETEENGNVVLLVPRFRSRFLSRWLLPMLPSRLFRVKLDGYGSFIWEMCDGLTDVSEMAWRIQDAFGTDVEPIYERIGKFLARLEREDFVVVGDSGDASRFG